MTEPRDSSEMAGAARIGDVVRTNRVDALSTKPCRGEHGLGVVEPRAWSRRASGGEPELVAQRSSGGAFRRRTSECINCSNLAHELDDGDIRQPGLGLGG